MAGAQMSLGRKKALALGPELKGDCINFMFSSELWRIISRLEHRSEMICCTAERSPLRKQGDQCESIADGETLVASIRVIASEAIRISPWISDVFEDKAKGPHYLIVGHMMKKEGLSEGRIMWQVEAQTESQFCQYLII